MIFNKKDKAISWIVAGLGNPGTKYAKTRHNVGFLTLDRIAEESGVKLDKVKFRALTNTTLLGGERVLLLKPQTYMNLSGESIRSAADYYKIQPDHILIIIDDISLPVGNIRIRKNGSAGGHNGLKSIISQIKSEDFLRIKIGVGEKPHPDYDLADWVLSTFSSDEGKNIISSIKRAADAAEELIANGPDSAANRFN